MDYKKVVEDNEPPCEIDIGFFGRFSQIMSRLRYWYLSERDISVLLSSEERADGTRIIHVREKEDE